MKKALFLCMVLILLLSYTVSYAQSSEINTLKVGLYYESTARDSVTLEAVSGFNYGVFNEAFELQGTFVETSLQFSAADNILVANGVLNIDYEIALYPVTGFIRINGSEYRGGVLLRASDSKITVINLVDIEEYLYGVLGGEMSSSWSIEALKAQAVCARNFTITNINKHASSGFNVCATTNCQVYKGVSAETEAVLRAVDETRGNVLMYNGAPAQTFYFSCSGGHTANVKNVWGSSFPYLSGVEDPYENPSTTPRHTWTAKLSSQDIKDALAKADIHIGDITNLKTETDNTGRVYSLKITGTEGTHTLKNQSTASVFSSYGVLGNKYSLSSPAAGTAELFFESASYITKAREFYVIDGSGMARAITNPFYAISADSYAVLNPFTTSSGDEYVFNGGGWGHGVGMSQYGAKGMAENGFTYSEILAHYFPGTYLETR